MPNWYSNKKIIIIGLGETGLSCINFLLKKGITPCVTDTRCLPENLNKIPKKVKYSFGEINEDWVLNSDLIIISPGIPSTHSTLSKASLRGIEIISDIEIFFREAKAPIIAITGSNGKSSVTTFLGEIVKSVGWEVGIGGNIGTPALNLLKNPKKLYILELSSFQLEKTFSFKTIAATILNVSPDHMDRYPLGIKQYQFTKQRIYKNAKFCIINADDPLTVPIFNKRSPHISFGMKNANYSINKENKIKWLKILGKKILNVKKIQLKGQHNHMNLLAALALANTIGIPNISSLTTLTKFTKTLPHRFQLIHKRNGISWINDSKATNVESTKAALSSIQFKRILWLLLGGDSKSANFSPLIPYLRKKNIRIFSFGKDKNILAKLNPEITICKDTLKKCMFDISKQVKPGDTVLLSPACSSLDQFKNFEERGHIFTTLAKKLG